MNFSALSANDRMAAVAAIIVIITGIISVINDWGAVVLLSVLAGAGVLLVVFQASIAPTMRLPMTRGLLLLLLGAVSTVVLVLVAFTWIDYILTPPIFVFDTIQYFIGLIAAVVMLYAGWREYQAERGTMGTAGPPPAPPPPSV